MSHANAINSGHVMRAMVDAFDWSSNPLGSRADWPAELETTVQHLLDSAFPKALVWGPHLVTIYNDAFRPILGEKPEALGRSFAEIWAEAWDEISGLVADAFDGRPTFIEDFPLIIERNGGPEQTYFTFCYSPVRLRNGKVGGMLDTVIETTKTVETRQDLELANQELAHRLKNSLAIVQALASQTLRDHAEPEALHSFERRLEALSHAHSVLLRQDWTHGSLRKAVEDSLDPNADLSRIAIAGKDIVIGSKTTMSFSMLLHELATNAMKYGALSTDNGTVSISWNMHGSDFRFEWRENGGPPVVPPEKPGFGSRLISRGVGGVSKGEIDYAPGGVVFTTQLPVVELAR